MNGHDPGMTPVDGFAACDFQSPLEGLVGSKLDRRIRNLRIVIRRDGMILRGRASSYHAKQLAQQAAMTVTALPIIANEIEVVCLPSGTLQRPGREEDRWASEPPRTVVLLATSDDRLTSVGGHYLTNHGYAVATADGGIECLALTHKLNPDADVVVLDSDLLWGGADGVIACLRAKGIMSIPIVLLTSHPNGSPGFEDSVAPPVVSVLGKPITPELLLGAIRSAAGQCGARA